MTTLFCPRRMRAGLLATLAVLAPIRPAAAGIDAVRVVANDNRRPAGVLADGTLTLRLHATRGTWRPEGPDGPAVEIEAFADGDGAPQVPAPLIRVPEGTTVAVTLVNDLPGPLTVHGLCTKGGVACAPTPVPPGESRAVTFLSGPAGTYSYWASAIGAPVPFREMGGAFVVDPAGAAPAGDRVFVITEWSSLAPSDLGAVMQADDPGEAFIARQPGVAFMINGLAWPGTERLSARVGVPERWRVVNLSSQLHPMHLHGFYFDVERVGDGLRDSVPGPRAPRRVVTYLMPPSGTLTMTWLPERAGRWLFHCHLMEHVAPERRLPRMSTPAASAGAADVHAAHAGSHRPSAPGGHAGHDAGLGMAGLVLGIDVAPAAGAASADPQPARPARRLTMALSDTSLHHEPPRPAITLSDGDASPADPPSSPGPPLVLRRDEPVEITVVNRLVEATAIHWHGMELESVYDGVHGWSGDALRTTPMIAPGDSFVVRFTPPRAGTFIYHTHLHDHRQLSQGLYGALVVTAPGEGFDPATDHALVLGRTGLTGGPLVLPDATMPVVLNGAHAPRFVWAAGTRHRLRLINITANDVFGVSLSDARGALTWRPIAKDGADLPEAARLPGPAAQTIAVGETWDVEIETPPGRRTLWLEVRTPAGRWELQGQIIVR